MSVPKSKSYEEVDQLEKEFAADILGFVDWEGARAYAAPEQLWRIVLILMRHRDAITQQP